MLMLAHETVHFELGITLQLALLLSGETRKSAVELGGGGERVGAKAIMQKPYVIHL